MRKIPKLMNEYQFETFMQPVLKEIYRMQSLGVSPLEQTAYLLSVMKQLSNVLRLSEHQYELTANTVLIRCENSCFADREKRFRTVNLADVRQKMDGVRFEKGDIDGTDCN